MGYRKKSFCYSNNGKQVDRRRQWLDKQVDRRRQWLDKHECRRRQWLDKHECRRRVAVPSRFAQPNAESTATSEAREVGYDK
jgi:hypothetical protein